MTLKDFKRLIMKLDYRAMTPAEWLEIKDSEYFGIKAQEVLSWPTHERKGQKVNFKTPVKPLIREENK